MKTLLLLIVFLALVWVPVLFSIYGWKEGLILTVSLGVASYLIDKVILTRRNKKDMK